MANYEKTMRGNFDEFLHRLDRGILDGSVSASFEGGSDYRCGAIRCAMRVYSRISLVSERACVSIMLIGNGDDLFLSVITSGGNKDVFYRINAIGEENFLSKVVDLVEEYKGEN